jgi:Rrf2 family protein
VILSRTSQYALQALIYMATQPRATPVLNRDIAARLGVPTAYLAKILQTFAKSGVLHSSRGRLGGFSLRLAPEGITLMSILHVTEGPSFTGTCLLGLKVCSDATACPVHNKWKPVKERIIALLEEQTLDKLAQAVESGRYRLSDVPDALFAEIAPA